MSHGGNRRNWAHPDSGIVDDATPVMFRNQIQGGILENFYGKHDRSTVPDTLFIFLEVFYILKYTT